MKQFGTRTYVALGLVLLLMTILLAAVLLGLVPDREGAVRAGRVALAEAVTAHGSALVGTQDLARMEAVLRLVVERNEDLLSAALRRSDREAVVRVGDHQRHWRDGEERSEAQIAVPIWTAEGRWGEVELRFADTAGSGMAALLRDPRVQLVGFVLVVAFVVFQFYLARVLRHLDPSRAVPPHVRAALDTLAEGLLVLDLKGQVVLANRAFARLVGQEPDRLLGYRVADLAWQDEHGKPLQSRATPWARALSGSGEQVSDTLRLPAADGVHHTFIVNCAPVLGDGQTHRGVLISLDDVTTLEEHREELRRSRDEAESANRAKSEFLANMSHEIRTPMNAILGFTEVLRRGWGRGSRDGVRHLDTIQRSGRHLLQLINDLLDLSKVESGRMEVEVVELAPHALVRDVADELRVKAEEKGIALDLVADGDLPASIQGDPTRLRQIVTNLVSNAIKFTDSGGVTVSLRCRPDTLDGRYVVAVRDSGIGIPQDKLEAVFDPFVQADNSVTRRFGGTGLGLAISRRFARMMGGDIVAGSRPGEGSTFTLSVATGPLDKVPWLAPEEALAAGDAAADAGATQWRISGGRVLVVDDGAENRELVRLVLEEAGVTVAGAENGREGVEMAMNDDYDVVLMDMQMPVMDGYSATRRLRELGFSKPVIALTANAMKGFEAECLAAGCSGYLTKPVDIDALLAELAGLMGGERVAVTGPTAPASPDAIAEAAPAEPLAVTAETPAASVGAPVVSRLAAAGPRLHGPIRRFASTLHERLPRMRGCLADGDAEALARHAHWLKGAGGTVGFDAFTEPAEQLETAARVGAREDMERWLATVEDLGARLAVPEEAVSQAAPAAADTGLPVAPAAAPAGRESGRSVGHG